MSHAGCVGDQAQLHADAQGIRGGALRSTFGVRLDVDPATNPDVIGDAWLPPFAKDSFDVVILDPPYVRFNAQVKCALFRAAGWVARTQAGGALCS